MTLTRWLAAALAAFVLGAAAHAAPLKIRVGWITVPTSFAPILGKQPALAPHDGKSYVVDPIHFDGSSQMTTALAAGDLDIAELSYSSFAYAIQNGHMNDLRIFADEIQDGVDGYFTTQYMVLNNGPVHRVEDLKGRVVATNVIGAGTDIGARAMLLRHGLKAGRDYTIIEASYANMAPLLESRKAALVPVIAPFFTPQLQRAAHTLFTLQDVMGPTQILMLAARKSFLDKNHAALVDYMEDYLRTLRWYIDPAHHAAAVKIIAAFTKIPAARLDRWVLTKRDQYRDPNGRPNLAATQRNIDAQRALGFLKIKLDVKKYADLSIVDAAAHRLGPATGTK